MTDDQEDGERLTEGGHWAMASLAKAYHDLPTDRTSAELQSLLHQLARKQQNKDG